MDDKYLIISEFGERSIVDQGEAADYLYKQKDGRVFQLLEVEAYYQVMDEVEYEEWLNGR